MKYIITILIISASLMACTGSQATTASTTESKSTEVSNPQEIEKMNEGASIDPKKAVTIDAKSVVAPKKINSIK